MSEETTKIILENIQDSVHSIKDKLDAMDCSIGKISEVNIRHDERLKMIEKRNENKDKELSEIISDNEKEHAKIKDKFDKLNVKMAMYAGAIGVIVFLAQYLFKYLTDYNK